MKSRPIVIEHLKIVHTSFIVNFSFTNNVTILTGAAGAGKSMVFSFIREHAAINEQLACINHLNYEEDIINIITNAEGKMIVIDNADILLSDDIRKQISLDGKNQYLIIGRNPKNLFATRENLFELINEKHGEQTEFRMKSCL